MLPHLFTNNLRLILARELDTIEPPNDPHQQPEHGHSIAIIHSNITQRQAEQIATLINTPRPAGNIPCYVHQEIEPSRVPTYISNESQNNRFHRHILAIGIAHHMNFFIPTIARHDWLAIMPILHCDMPERDATRFFFDHPIVYITGSTPNLVWHEKSMPMNNWTPQAITALREENHPYL